jgi:hypothetical protein
MNQQLHDTKAKAWRDSVASFVPAPRIGPTDSCFKQSKSLGSSASLSVRIQKPKGVFVKIQIERGERANFIARLWPLALMPFYLRPLLSSVWNSFSGLRILLLVGLPPFAAIDLPYTSPAGLGLRRRPVGKRRAEFRLVIFIGAGVSSRSYTCVPLLISSLPILWASFLDLCLGCDYLRRSICKFVHSVHEG